MTHVSALAMRCRRGCPGPRGWASPSPCGAVAGCQLPQRGPCRCGGGISGGGSECRVAAVSGRHPALQSLCPGRARGVHTAPTLHYIQELMIGTSLGVQWLRIHLAIQGMVGELRPHMLQSSSAHVPHLESPCAARKDPELTQRISCAVTKTHRRQSLKS